MRTALAALGEVVAWWAVLVVVNVLFISTVSPLELVVVAGGALIAAVAARAVHTASHARLGDTRRWAAAALAWPGAVLTDLVGLCGVTARALGGRSPEGSLKKMTLASGAGAAWACALLSSTPGAYVVDVLEPRETGRAPQTAVAHFLTDDRTRLEDVLTEGMRR
ncbi:hypothetical protein [Streptomyces alanosinicus]|uniref:Uncharacterized protein n=1 Tax=Streptomyces alanosinicus TaxID=68171 RepID=A0A918YDQ1_9ACTN|nr:hypothetical protein [Streptomyces alanosinicus]GHD98505.1 hypothetical protein GCM10010339_05950 [Streptomyces alanosinicus]